MNIIGAKVRQLPLVGTFRQLKSTAKRCPLSLRWYSHQVLGVCEILFANRIYFFLRQEFQVLKLNSLIFSFWFLISVLAMKHCFPRSIFFRQQ